MIHPENEQYERRFRSYLNSTETSRQRHEVIRELLDVANHLVTRHYEPPSSTSRLPGISFVHLLFRRLFSRHNAALLKRSDEVDLMLLRLIKELYEGPFAELSRDRELERRVHDGLMDRIAEIDAILIRLAALEASQSVSEDEKR